MPKVSVIVVTFNSESVIAACLASLRRKSETHNASIEIIVVDNASQDRTLAVTEEVCPEATILRNIENVGFAKAVNKAATIAEGDYILLLNPDATFSLPGIEQLVLGMQDEDVGVIAPLITHPTGRLRIVSAGYLPTTWRMVCHYSGLSRLGRRFRYLRGHYLLKNQLDAVNSVEWVTGACLMLSMSLWKDLGGLSERWFMYAEDVELCDRVRRRGLDVRLLRDVEAGHMVGGSQGEDTVSLNPAWIVNLYDYYARSLSKTALDRALWRSTVALGLASRSLVFSVLARQAKPLAASRWSTEANRFRTFARAVWRLPQGANQS